MNVFKKSKMITLNVFKISMDNLDVFNMPKTSNMYILNIFLKRYCAVWETQIQETKV